jgi:hypothetical protein
LLLLLCFCFVMAALLPVAKAFFKFPFTEPPLYASNPCASTASALTSTQVATRIHGTGARPAPHPYAMSGDEARAVSQGARHEHGRCLPVIVVWLAPLSPFTPSTLQFCVCICVCVFQALENAALTAIEKLRCQESRPFHGEALHFD